jgi:hypothetical protein
MVTKLLQDIDFGSSSPNNILDNAGFEVWQRGTSFTNPINSSFVGDRWSLGTNGTPTMTVTQESTTVDTGLYSMKVNITAAGGATFLQIQQSVENYKAYAGKTITLSMRVWSTAACNLELAAGAGNYSISSNHPGDSNWHTLSCTYTVPTSPSFLIAFFTAAATTNILPATYYIDSAMLVVGSQPVNFIPLHPQIDFARCQRYYENVPSLEDQRPIGNATNSDNSTQAGFMFRSQKAVVPTVTINKISVTLIAFAQGSFTSLLVDTANWTLTSQSIDVNQFTLKARKGSVSSTYGVIDYFFGWTADTGF